MKIRDYLTASGKAASMAQTIALIAIVEDEYELTENTQIIKSYSFVIQGKSSFRTECTLLFHA